ncbi:MAG: chalcone isomerase family protein [Gammaproteobacteria bacterium]|nr:chalcone isomerase family protein [Gammaproteobacteria bacterium]
MKPAAFGMLLLLTFPLTVYSSAVMEPSSGIPDYHPVGKGKLTWLGMTVYEATLLTPNGTFEPEQPFALRIDYRFGFSRTELAQSSIKEIEKLHGKHPDKATLRSQLESVFRDVANGDHIIGVYQPGEGAAFYSDNQLLGRLDNPELAQTFFSIWLSPHTREPELRAQLLGEQG